MLEDHVLFVDADTARDDRALTNLVLLVREVLALWPRPAIDGVVMPGYPCGVITWSLS